MAKKQSVLCQNCRFWAKVVDISSFYVEIWQEKVNLVSKMLFLGENCRFFGFLCRNLARRSQVLVFNDKIGQEKVNLLSKLSFLCQKLSKFCCKGQNLSKKGQFCQNLCLNWQNSDLTVKICQKNVNFVSKFVKNVNLVLKFGFKRSKFLKKSQFRVKICV